MVAVLKSVRKDVHTYKAFGLPLYFQIPEHKAPGLIVWEHSKLGKDLADRIEAYLDRKRREEERRKNKDSF